MLIIKSFNCTQGDCVHIVVAVFGEPSKQHQSRILCGKLLVASIQRHIFRVDDCVIGDFSFGSGIGAGVFLYNRRFRKLLAGKVFEFGDAGEILVNRIVDGAALLEPCC